MRKCDEIKVMWNDRKIIFDLIEKYPDKRINLCKYYIHNEEDIDWNEIKQFHVLAKNNFLFGVTYIDDLIEGINREYPMYYLSPVATWDELTALSNIGVKSVLIDAPLFFKMPKVVKFNIPVRVTANLAQRKLIPRDNGLQGPWIRPEDVEMYEPYIDTIEFARVSKTQEQALYRIYAEQHEWRGDLNLIIEDLNYSITNRMLPPGFAEARLNCGQRCMEPGYGCHQCTNLALLANPEYIKRLMQA